MLFELFVCYNNGMDNTISEVDKLYATPQGAIEMAATHFQMQLHSLLVNKFEERFQAGEVSLAALSERLGVSEERVLSVIEGTSDRSDVESSILVYARYLRALDYELSFSVAEPTKGYKFS